MANMLPLPIFPGFTQRGVVSPSVLEIATVFNAEGVEALQAIPEKPVAWADVCTRVTPGVVVGQAKIPVRLTSLLGFEPFNGERRYHTVTVAAVSVAVTPFSLGLEWPIQFDQSGIAQLQEFYGISGIANDVVSHARAQKADMLASMLAEGFTSVALQGTYGAHGYAKTIDQPGYVGGLPLFSGGLSSGGSEITAKHFANPLDANSTRFANLFYGAGQITDPAVFGSMLTKMSQVPHPSKANMTMGLEVTDIIGGTAMLVPFWQAAVQALSLATTTSGGALAAAATTNIYNPQLIKERGPEALVGASGIAPWRFWIAPQLDAHPYLQANPTKQMWFAVSTTRKSGAFAEFAAPTKDFVPRITLLGDGSEEAVKSRKVRLFGDLDAGVAPGLPHFIQMFTETAPAS